MLNKEEYLNELENWGESDIKVFEEELKGRIEAGIFNDETNELKLKLNRFALIVFRFVISKNINHILEQDLHSYGQTFEANTYMNDQDEINEIQNNLQDFVAEMKERSPLLTIQFWVDKEEINTNENCVWKIRVNYESDK